VLNRSDYNKKMYELLNVPNNYNILDKDPTLKYEKMVNNFVNVLFKNNKIDEGEKNT